MAQWNCSACNHTVTAQGTAPTAICPQCGGIMHIQVSVSAPASSPIPDALTAPTKVLTRLREASSGAPPRAQIPSTASKQPSAKLQTGTRIKIAVPRSRLGVYLAAGGIVLILASIWITALQWFAQRDTDTGSTVTDALQEERSQLLDEMTALRKKAQELHERERNLTRDVALAMGQNQQNGVASTQLLAKAEKSVIIVKTESGWGSGFIIDDTGLAATNFHVVAGSSKLSVTMQKMSSHEQVTFENVKLVAVNKKRDLALLQLPSPPPDIGANGKYPILRLRTEQQAQTGEDVFAIGSPALGPLMLDYTVTRGIVSNPERDNEAGKVIQVSAVVNPGNSGGPLIDSNGAVVGVVVAKALVVEAVSLVIPVRDLKTFCEQRNDDAFAVTTTLQDWEKAHDKPAAMERKFRELVGKPLIELKSHPDALVLAADGQKLYTLDGEGGKITEYALPSGTPGNTCTVGSMVTDIVPYGSNYLLASAPESSETLRIALNDLTVSGRCKTPDAAMTSAGIEGYGQTALLFRSRGRPWLIDQTWFQKPQVDTGEFPALDPYATYFAAGVTSQWMIVADVPTNSTQLRINAYPLNSCMALLSRFLSDVLQARSKRTNLFNLMPMKEMSRIHVSTELNGFTMVREGTRPDRVLVWNSADNFIFAKRVYRISGSRIECLGSFSSMAELLTPDSLKPGKSADLKDAIHELDNILTVSPEGSWAVSGLCVYSIASRMPRKLLPFPCTTHVFTSDGRGIFLVGQSGIYFFPNWESQFPEIGSKP